MELRWLERHTTINYTENIGSKRYPNVVTKVRTEQETVLQWRNHHKDEWTDVETDFEFLERNE